MSAQSCSWVNLGFGGLFAWWFCALGVLFRVVRVWIGLVDVLLICLGCSVIWWVLFGFDFCWLGCDLFVWIFGLWFRVDLLTWMIWVILWFWVTISSFLVFLGLGLVFFGWWWFFGILVGFVWFAAGWFGFGYLWVWKLGWMFLCWLIELGYLIWYKVVFWWFWLWADLFSWVLVILSCWLFIGLLFNLLL